MIAALYVQTGGAYYNLPSVDPWDEARDARLYAGPWPVVAHPPCARWGRFYAGSPKLIAATGNRFTVGDDGGCFAAALAAVRRWGGVLEHPADSKAWPAFGLLPPPRSGGCIRADWFDGYEGWTCRVEQAAYGHRAQKATWLYAVGCDLPSLKWGAHGPYEAVCSGFARPRPTILSARWRSATPHAFRDLLIAMARSAQKGNYIVHSLASDFSAFLRFLAADCPLSLGR